MGGEVKETEMVLNVNLGCKKCILKIKKLLCCTPQIRDQKFNEKSNTVTIKVICCTPEKVADKLRCKAGGTIKGIKIKPSQPPSETPEDKPEDNHSKGTRDTTATLPDPRGCGCGCGCGYLSIFPHVENYFGGPHYQNQVTAGTPQWVSLSYLPVYHHTGLPAGHYIPEENPSTCSVM